MAKDRSPNYPAVGLGEAIQLVRQLWTKEKRVAVTSDVAAKAISYTSLSGPARTKLSALKKYGLVEDDREGMRVSDLAMKILHPANPNEQESGIREAALKPDLFRELYETHADASDDALTSNLIRREFSPAGARLFIEAFRDTLSVAKLSGSGYTPPKSTQEPEAMATTTHERAVGDVTTASDSARAGRVVPLSWVLSKNVSAELRIVGGPLTKAEADRLRQYVDLTVSALIADAD